MTRITVSLVVLSLMAANVILLLEKEEKSTPLNSHPIADSGGPYFSTEGTEVTFDGSGSFDPDGDSIKFRWDFDDNGDWDTDWSESATTKFIYGDDYRGEARLEVIEVFANQTDITQREPATHSHIINDLYIRAQSFVPNASKLTKIAIDIVVNWGHPEYELFLNVSENLYGPNLTWTSLSANQIPKGLPFPPGPWPVFDFPDIDLVPNQTYYFILTSGRNRNGTYEFRYCKDDPYAEGAYFFKEWPWEWVGTSMDVRFETYTELVGLSDTANAQVVIENSVPMLSTYHFDTQLNNPRTQGYWKHQCSIDSSPSPDHIGIKEEFVESVARNSAYFNWLTSKEEVCGILLTDSGSDMRLKAEEQLMPTWLNFVSGKISEDTRVLIDMHSIDGRFLDVLLEMDAILMNENNPSQLEMVKDVADSINNGEGVALASVQASATAEDQGSDDLILTWDWGDGTIDRLVFYNNGLSPDLYPSIELNPISVTSNVAHLYHTKGIFHVNLYIEDDDGEGVSILVMTVSIP
jgi:hypothetical protein